MALPRILFILNSLPKSWVDAPFRTPPNSALFCSGGVYFSPEAGRVISSSHEDAKAFNEQHGGKFVILDEFPVIRRALTAGRSLSGKKIAPHERRAERISFDMGAIPSAMFSLGATGDLFNVVLRNPHPLAVFRSIELPILMCRCKHLTKINDITRNSEGELSETIKDKWQWFEEKRDEWLEASLKEFQRAKESYASGDWPYEVYLSSAKRVGAEIRESLIYLQLNKELHAARLHEEQRLEKALSIAKEITELHSVVTQASGRNF